MTSAVLLAACALVQDLPPASPWKATALENAGTLTDVWFTGPKEGWVLGINGSIHRTADGGVTWERRRHSTGVAEENIFDYILFRDAKQGWVLDSTAQAETAVPLLRATLATRDGGRTWAHCKPQDDEPAWSALFWARRGTTTAGVEWRPTGGDGVFWRRSGQARLAEAKDHPGVARLGLKDLNLRDVSFPTPRDGFLAGWGDRKGLLLRTTDGGVTWRAAPIPDEHEISQVCMLDAAVGWILARQFDVSTIYATTDGGKNWIPEWKSPSGGFLRRLLFPHSGLGLAIGVDGRVLRLTR